MSGPPTGFCSGVPLLCPELGTADCATASGCVDQGTCSGVPTTIGAVCQTALTFQSCTPMAGCFWTTDCTGTQLGNCTEVTEAACVATKGCFFTNTGGFGGVGGSLITGGATGVFTGGAGGVFGVGGTVIGAGGNLGIGGGIAGAVGAGGTLGIGGTTM